MKATPTAWCNPADVECLGSEWPFALLRYLNDRAGADPAEWPADLRVREFPK